MYIKSRIGWQALTRDEYLDNGDYYLVTGTDFTENNTIDFSKCYYVSKERYEMDDKIQLKAGDLIVTKDGTIGKVAYIESLDKPATLNSHLFVLRDQSGEISGKYLLYVLSSYVFKDFVNSIKTGSTLTGLPQKDMIKFEYGYPSIVEQDKIINFLTLIDKRIETQNKIIEDYEVYKKNIEMKILLKGHKCVSKLSDLCSITTGKKDANAATSDGKYKFFTCGREDLLINTYSFDGDAILISGNGEVGLTKFYSGKFDAYQRTYVLQNFKIDPIYLKMIIDQKLKTKIMREKNVGAMPYIVLSTLENFEIPLIDEKETLLISRLIKMLDDKIKKEKDMLDAYKKQKAYLLKEMFI